MGVKEHLLFDITMIRELEYFADFTEYTDTLHGLTNVRKPPPPFAFVIITLASEAIDLKNHIKKDMGLVTF